MSADAMTFDVYTQKIFYVKKNPFFTFKVLYVLKGYFDCFNNPINNLDDMERVQLFCKHKAIFLEKFKVLVRSRKGNS